MKTKPNTEIFKIKRLPKSARREILRTEGAQAEVARLANCSRALVCMVLRGERSCNQKLWDAIAEWLDEPRDRGALRDMARVDMGIVAEAFDRRFGI